MIQIFYPQYSYCILILKIMFNVTITTVDKQLFNGSVYAVICPGSGGELTILARHMPFITTLAKGTISVKKHKDGEAETFPVGRGLLEVSNNRAVILV